MSTYDASQGYKEEKIPEFDLTRSYTKESMIKRIKELEGCDVTLLERSFIKPWSNETNEENGNGCGSDVVVAAPSLKIMQWNILAQGLALGSDNFVCCPAAALDWATRRFRVLEEILVVDPDVVCMQEVDHFHFFEVMLGKVGYVGKFFPKPDSPCLFTRDSNGPDGCAVFYKTCRLDLVKQQCIVLKDNGLETNQVSIMNQLKDKESDRDFCVATTHLKAKPGHEQLRLAQGQHLLEEVSRFSDSKPVVVCGDFNADPQEPVIQAFGAGSIGLRSAYKELSPGGEVETPYTTWKIRGGKKPGSENSEVCRTIDYIWFRKGGFRIDSLLSFPSGEDIGPNRLPCWRYPSDHFSLAATVSFV